MIELSTERIEQILNEETVKKAETTAILRSIYTRYMLLYERYFTDIDALNDDKIAQFKNYHEETISLFKYYYLDIPQDTCLGLTGTNIFLGHIKNSRKILPARIMMRHI